METGGGSGLRTRQGKLVCGDPAPNCCIWECKIHHPVQWGCTVGAGLQMAAKKGPHGLGMGLEVGLAQLCWPGDHILQLRAVFILEVGSKQYLL